MKFSIYSNRHVFVMHVNCLWSNRKDITFIWKKKSLIGVVQLKTVFIAEVEIYLQANPGLDFETSTGEILVDMICHDDTTPITKRLTVPLENSVSDRDTFL